MNGQQILLIFSLITAALCAVFYPFFHKSEGKHKQQCGKLREQQARKSEDAKIVPADRPEDPRIRAIKESVMSELRLNMMAQEAFTQMAQTAAVNRKVQPQPEKRGWYQEAEWGDK